MDRAVIQLESTHTVTLMMYNAFWRRSDGTTGVAMRPAFQGLALPDTIRPPSTGNLITDIEIGSSLLVNPSRQFLLQVDKLDRLVNDTLASIQIETQVRLSYSLGCIMLILIGIALGIKLKGGHLLTAFGVGSIPAAILVLCIIMGKNLAYNRATEISGIALMWCGLGLLSVLTLILYRKLLRT
ncbi:MAG TPA: LptF/LptG family permease [Sedimentisphaerales bacterium]|nr:LptF/LptG family permease [Sedimentisphaerales bacterium]